MLRVTVLWNICFFFQAEDCIRVAQESRGLGDVYKRQLPLLVDVGQGVIAIGGTQIDQDSLGAVRKRGVRALSLIHI